MRSKFRELLLCLTLLVGAFGGVPMRPEEIEELMGSMSRPKIEYTIPDQKENEKPALPG
jgi:hypothetical protein